MADKKHALFEMVSYEVSGQQRLYVNCIGSVPGELLAHKFSLKDKFNLNEAPWLGSVNRFYSVAQVDDSFFGQNGRKGKTRTEDFVSQHWIPFDLDKLDEPRIQEYIQAVEEVVPTDGQRIYIWTGNGLQVLFRVWPFYDVAIFDKKAAAYRNICRQISLVLKDKRLTYEAVDSYAWEASRMLRLPGTINQKYNPDGTPKPPKACYLIDIRGSGPSNRLSVRFGLKTKKGRLSHVN